MRSLWMFTVLVLGSWVTGVSVGAEGGGPLISPEKLILLPVPGETREDAEIARWQAQVGAPGVQAAQIERLGWAFVAKARRTQDGGFYRLAICAADVMDRRWGVSADSRLLRAHALHNLHRFAEAETVARTLTQERGLAWGFSLLSDVCMEQGRIEEAVVACQQSMNLRPGAEAYARASHLRWLRGDLPGAVEAMSTAVRASSPRDGETYAWALVRLSHYRLQQGQLELASRLADLALVHVADYPPALLASGQAAWARGDRAGAVVTLRRAVHLNPLPEYRWWLADALRAQGDQAGADELEAQILRHGEAGDPRTLSLFLATRGVQAARAVALAQTELTVRRDVFTYDALAWAQAAAGQWPAAAAALKAALAEGTCDARLFLHAGLITRGQGDEAACQAWLKKAQPLAATLPPSEHDLLERAIRAAPLGAALDALPASAAPLALR